MPRTLFSFSFQLFSVFPLGFLLSSPAPMELPNIDSRWVRNNRESTAARLIYQAVEKHGIPNEVVHRSLIYISELNNFEFLDDEWIAAERPTELKAITRRAGLFGGRNETVGTYYQHERSVERAVWMNEEDSIRFYIDIVLQYTSPFQFEALQYMRTGGGYSFVTTRNLWFGRVYADLLKATLEVKSEDGLEAFKQRYDRELELAGRQEDCKPSLSKLLRVAQ